MGNRLRRIDIFLLKYDPTLLARCDDYFARAFFVDLGYGATPTTTFESLARLRTVNSTLPVLGVEIDPERVAAAHELARAGYPVNLRPHWLRKGFLLWHNDSQCAGNSRFIDGSL